MNLPIISIITVSYNAVSTIENTILSVINQTYPHIEYIIIDGGSSDGTVDIIKKYSDKISYWVSEPDKGIYDAMNKGISIAKGELIGIINSDDWYEPNIFMHIAENYSNSKNKEKIYYGDLEKCYNEYTRKIIKPKRALNQFWMGTIIGHPTVFIPSIVYKKYGVFNLEYKISADYDLLVRMYKHNIQFEYIPRIISHMRTGGESDRNVIQGYKEAFNIALRAGFPIDKVIYAYIRKCAILYIIKPFIIRKNNF